MWSRILGLFGDQGAELMPEYEIDTASEEAFEFDDSPELVDNEKQAKRAKKMMRTPGMVGVYVTAWTWVGVALMAVSMALSALLLVPMYQSGLSGQSGWMFWLMTGLGVITAMAIDGAKCVTATALAVYFPTEDNDQGSGRLTVVLVAIMLVALTFSLLATAAKFSRDMRKSTIEGYAYKAVDSEMEMVAADAASKRNQISAINTEISAYQNEQAATGYHQKKELYQGKIDAANVRKEALNREMTALRGETRGLRHEKDEVVASGTGGENYMQQKLRRIMPGLSLDGINVIIGLMIEAIGLGLLMVFGAQNRELIQAIVIRKLEAPRYKKIADLVLARAEATKRFHEAVKYAKNAAGPLSIRELHDEMEKYDAAVISAASSAALRGGKLPPRVKKLVEALPPLPDQEPAIAGLARDGFPPYGSGADTPKMGFNLPDTNTRTGSAPNDLPNDDRSGERSGERPNAIFPERQLPNAERSRTGSVARHYIQRAARIMPDASQREIGERAAQMAHAEGKKATVKGYAKSTVCEVLKNV
ncbi:hypothetical protein KAH55_01795 [bacterium]|nr:hypothetical protein [bacterium]